MPGLHNLYTPVNQSGDTVSGAIAWGDIPFTETECDICNKPFKPKEFLVLVVREIKEMPGKQPNLTLAYPVHLKCAKEV